MEYTIKYVCDTLHLTIHTVRHYCDKGLVPNLKYDQHGHRLFDEESLHWLQATLFLKESGLSLNEIKHFFDLCLKGEATLEERKDILIQLKEKALDDLIKAKERVTCLEDKIQGCQEALQGLHEDECNPLNW